MLGKNIPARFLTGKGSSYVVDEGGVTRDKIADPQRKTERKEKNIYYHTKDQTLALEKVCEEGWDPGLVIHVSGDRYRLFLTHPNEKKDRCIAMFMTNKPAVGLYPFDLFLESNGMAAKEHACHYGNEITQITG